jgi:hypothetical protein
MPLVLWRNSGELPVSLHAMIRNRPTNLHAWLLGLVVTSMCIHAQAVDFPIRAELVADSVVSSYVAEWERIELVLTNQSNRTIRCTPRAVFTKNGQLLARTSVPRTELWQLAPGERVRLHGATIMGKLVTTHAPAHSSSAWQVLPDTGTISLCVHITDSLGIEHFAAPLCRTLSVFAYSLPIPLGPNPSDTFRLRRQSAIRFVWIPVLPRRSRTCYVVRCYRLPDSLIIAEAVRVQAPLVETRVCDTNELRWQAGLLSPGRYVWSLQALDRSTHMPIGSSDGYSIALPFHVASNPATRKMHHRRQRR